MMYSHQTNSLHYIHIHDNAVDDFNIIFSIAAVQINTHGTKLLTLISYATHSKQP